MLHLACAVSDNVITVVLLVYMLFQPIFGTISDPGAGHTAGKAPVAFIPRSARRR